LRCRECFSHPVTCGCNEQAHGCYYGRSGDVMMRIIIPDVYTKARATACRGSPKRDLLIKIPKLPGRIPYSLTALSWN